MANVCAVRMQQQLREAIEALFKHLELPKAALLPHEPELFTQEMYKTVRHQGLMWPDVGSPIIAVPKMYVFQPNRYTCRHCGVIFEGEK